jgi:hypothetical protein
MILDAQLAQNIETARQLIFSLAEAEQALGLEILRDMPLSARIQRVLAGAMARPGIVSPQNYEAAFELRRFVIASRSRDSGP